MIAFYLLRFLVNFRGKKSFAKFFCYKFSITFAIPKINGVVVLGMKFFTTLTCRKFKKNKTVNFDRIS